MPTPQQPSLFRPSAAAKIRSPEQLDALLPITSSWSWLALAAIGLALLAAVVWGFAGTVVRTADGMGLIVRDSYRGIIEVSSQASGVLVDVKVDVGDVVEPGQVVATLDFSQLQAEIENARETYRTLEEQDRIQQKDEEERLGILREKLANQNELFRRGLVTKSTLLETRTQIYETEGREFQRQQRLLEQKVRLRELETRFNSENVVRSVHSGRVTEVVIGPGTFVQPGRTIVRMESTQGEYEALVYVPVVEGKKIKAGMVARLSPSIVKAEEYGYLLSTVKLVSPFPVTREYLMAELGGDERLVDLLLRDGSAIEFLADLDDDPSTPSGFRWSSSQGPDLRLESGTVCQVSVVLERVRPITLLVPFLKKQLGIY